MGFGFNLIFVFILVPLVGILFFTWLGTQNQELGKILGLIILGLCGLTILSAILHWVTPKTVLEKKDYYGEYIVNRHYFAGRQADWQYNSFRFEIKENDSIYFYVTDKDKILETYCGAISTCKPFNSERLVIKMEQPSHHIMTSNPTIYRRSWSFFLVFYSPKFNNVYFEKGEWEPLDP